jgi:hypothetical protein
MREAADSLGVSKEAIRKRVIRGTLRSETGEDGRRYVYLDTDTDTDEAPTHERDALITQMQAEIEYLREENRRKDHLLAAALERIPPQLEAPQETPPDAPGSPETDESGADRGSPPEAEPVAQEAASSATPQGTPRPWWRRVFGG